MLHYENVYEGWRLFKKMRLVVWSLDLVLLPMLIEELGFD